MDTIQKYAKAIVALIGSVLTAGVFVLPVEAQPWVGLGLAVLTAAATYQVPNKGAPTDALVQGDGLAAGDDAPKHLAD
ncbi:hypothetical protein [Curtobacterium sp. MCBA15_004]|uniref:hypothetical protein n=1 Tax=Curtobacterium sp. MCBA15_004 TaxID=1898733 RepID=UPI0008DDE05C|nr:hypothetical protein [Curtobacterium sp. MCBA15_004]WIA95792.1 hypothetical protein QOL16_11800 [Curtobacterium sp. MCBA15_004]